MVTKEAPAVLAARFYFGSHFFPPTCSSAVKPQMRGAILKNREENPDADWKFTGRVSSQITAFQPNFYFSVLRLAKQSSGNVAFTRRRITTVILLEKLPCQNTQKAALRDSKVMML